MPRLDRIKPAARPKMHGRAMLSGPAGSGKSFTSLSIASELAAREDREHSVLVIDTERESALTYADVFRFDHLPWAPPFDPGELTHELDALGDRYAVVIIDSLSHFWRSQGGTLDIADGKIGGWKVARPVQEALVQAMLAIPAHLIVCVRSKMDYLIEGGNGTKQTVTKLGMAPIQDDTLVYEMNVALDIDTEHRITVTKSRTTAVPVGRMYPAGLERKCAEDYAEWLAGGIPPADRVDIERIVARFADIADAERRTTVKQAFVQLFGMPQSLTAPVVAEAEAWLDGQMTAGDTPKPDAAGVAGSAGEADSGAVEPSGAAGAADTAPESSTGAEGGTVHAPMCGLPTDHDGDCEYVPTGDAAPVPDGGEAARLEAIIAHVGGLDDVQVMAELGKHPDVTAARSRDGRKRQYAELLVAEGWQPDTVDAATLV